MTETWLDDLDWLLLLAVLFVVLVEWHSMSDKTTQTTGWTEADYSDPSNQNRQGTSEITELWCRACGAVFTPPQKCDCERASLALLQMLNAVSSEWICTKSMRNWPRHAPYQAHRG